MIGLKIPFTAGQYHATPWGRHVNEGETEWPPSPWRVLRALLATWFRHEDALAQEYSKDDLKDLISALAEVPPAYSLPHYTVGQTRHYMPTKGSALVLDPFYRIDPGEPLAVIWEDTTLDDRLIRLLEALASKMPYLGRAESWVEVSVLREWDAPITAWPWVPTVDTTVSTLQEVLCPESSAAYQRWLRRARETQPAKRMSIPETVFDALLMDTLALQKQGWSQPPGSRWLLYHFQPTEAPRRRTATSRSTSVVIARLALSGKPLPRNIHTVVLGDTFRRALLKKMDGQPIPWILTGREDTGEPSKRHHRHGFFLPEDTDGDGLLDHLLLYIPDGIPDTILHALARLKTLYSYHMDWEGQVLLEGWGSIDDFKAVSRLIGSSATWRSETPFYFPWHVKRQGKYSRAEQITRLIAERYGSGPDGPRILKIDDVTVQHGKPNPVQFRRDRPYRSGAPCPDAQGQFLRLTFDRAVDGPLALGYNSHYGLGLFVPEYGERGAPTQG
jgi:CRISPR-associated protein Csb2